MSTRRTAPDVAWTPYLEAFHVERAGITEEMSAATQQSLRPG